MEDLGVDHRFFLVAHYPVQVLKGGCLAVHSVSDFLLSDLLSFAFLGVLADQCH